MKIGVDYFDLAVVNAALNTPEPTEEDREAARCYLIKCDAEDLIAMLEL